ncbi:MAG: hypothetical protein HRS57_00615 [Mycoplasmataceae bacterium]|nr:hypothetical protein [Mycoplasmataceae bacterium]
MSENSNKQKYLFRKERTHTYITSGYHRFFVDLFHFLPWLFVVMDSIIFAFVNTDSVNSKFLEVFIILIVELFILYFYSIFIEVHGLANIIKALKIKEPDINHESKSHSWFTSKIDQRHIYSTNVTMRKNMKLDHSGNSTNLVDSHNKFVNGKMTMTMNSWFEVLTLRSAYVDIEIHLDDGWKIWSSEAYVSSAANTIRFLVKRNRELSHKSLYSGTLIFDSNKKKINYVLDSDREKIKSGTIVINK